ncbi:hypothetical protein [Ammoniphilus sp. 3BR4]|uniref:hypothetical protein n=1 Tax=Ammoniphilus sp. 3BR4 TaxID=3158265 RepID=UPI00346679C2
MEAVLKVKKETGYGPNHLQVEKWITRLSEVKWFSALGQSKGQGEAENAWKTFIRHLDLDDTQVVWMTKDQLPSFVEELSLGNSPLWSRIQWIPKQLKDKTKELGREAVLAYTIENIPEMLFHKAFDGAFPELNEYGERMVKVAVGSVMYIFGLACAWETLADIEGWETNPFTPLIEVFEAGHWPVGMTGNQVYII